VNPDEPRPEGVWTPPPEPEPQTRPRRTRYLRTANVAAPLVAAALIGGGAGYLIFHHGGSTANVAAPVATPAADAGAPSFGDGGNGGPIAGEQHIVGTVAATTDSTVTVKTSDGSSTTYTVNATTEIMRNGQAATLSEIQAGDPVLVHVYPSSSGEMLVEKVYAGFSANDGGRGFHDDQNGSLGTT
jgi:hypothetical protein